MRSVADAAKDTKERIALARRADAEEYALANGRRNKAKEGGFRHVVLCREFLESGRHSLRPTTALLLMMLANYSDKRGRCHPAQERLAACLGVSGRSVSKALRTLIDERLVEIVSRGYGQGKRRTNEYQLRTPGSGWPALTPIDKIKQSK